MTPALEFLSFEAVLERAQLGTMLSFLAIVRIAHTTYVVGGETCWITMYFVVSLGPPALKNAAPRSVPSLWTIGKHPLQVNKTMVMTGAKLSL